jgi:hypothetical protein
MWRGVRARRPRSAAIVSPTMLSLERIERFEICLADDIQARS